MAGLTVGAVYVDVRPDLRGWNRELRSKLIPPTSKVGDEVGETLAGPVKESLRDAIPDGVKAGGRQARPAAAKQGEDNAGAFAQSFRAKLEAALRNMPDVKVEADTTVADKRLLELRQRIKALRGATVGVDLNAEDARKQLDELALELRTLSREDARMDVRVDAAAAAAQLESLGREVDKLDGRQLDITIDNNSYLSASAYQSHIRKILKGVTTLAPAVTAALGAATGGALGLASALGVAGAGATAFGVALVGSVVEAGAAEKELTKLEEKFDAAADSAERFKIVGEINTLLARLTPETRAFMQQIDQLRASWRQFLAATRPQTLAIAGRALDAVRGALGGLPAIVNAVTPPIERFVGTIEDWVSGSGYRTFLGFMQAEAPRALDNLGRLMTGLATGIGGVVAAFTPFGQQFLQVLAEGAERFAIWGQQLGATSGFQQFIAYIQQTGPQVFNLLKTLADAIISIGVALAPLSGPTIAILQTFAEILNTVADVAPGLIQASVAIFAVSQAVGSFGNTVNAAREKVSNFVTTLQSGRGGMAGAIAGMRGALTGVVGALGGPWGVAIAGGITALGFLANAHAKAKQRSDELKQSLDQTTGAITAQTKENIKKTLQEAGAVKMARELGLSARDVQLAAEGEAAAIQRVTEQVDSLLAAQRAQRDAAAKDSSVGAQNQRFLELNDTYAKTTVTARELLGLIGTQNKDIVEQRAVIADYNALMGGWRERVSGLTFATKEEAEAHGIAGQKIKEQRNELALLVEQMKKNRAEALGFANAEIGYQQALDDVTESVKENGKNHDINTQKGRDNMTALLGLAAAQNKLADDVKFTAKPLEDQSRILTAQRQQFIDAGVAIGLTRTQAAALADQYLKTPAEIKTQAKFEAEQKKYDDWKKGLDNLPKNKATSTTILQDALGLGQWKNAVETIPDQKATGTTIIKDALGLGSWKNSVETIPGKKDTKTDVIPDPSGVQKAKDDIASLPDSVRVVVNVALANYAFVLGQLAVLRAYAASRGGQHGGVVGEDIMRFAQGGIVDMRRGGVQPGFSAKDNRIGLFRDGEAVLVPEVTKALGGRKVIEALNKAGSNIVEVLRKVLGIHSPSKVMIDLGRWIVAGLVKGLTGSVSKVESTVKQLGDRIYNAFVKQFGLTKGRRLSSALTKSLSDETRRLTTLAKQRESVAAKLKVAQDKLADAVKAREDFARNIREQVMGFGAITGLTPSGQAPTSEGFIAELRNRVEESKQFTKTLAELRKRGLNLTTYRQLVEAGVDTGGPIAQALLEGGTGAIKQINALTSQLGAVAKDLGARSSRELYQAGVNSAQALVRGLQSQAKALANAAKKLADQIVKYLKRALKIKSPSQLLADQVGQFLPLGVAQGIERNADAITDALLPRLTLTYGTRAGSAQGIQVGEYNPGTFTKGNRQQRQPLYLVLEDGTQFRAYIDNRADGRLSAAARRAKTGVKR